MTTAGETDGAEVAGAAPALLAALDAAGRLPVDERIAALEQVHATLAAELGRADSV